MVHVKRSLEILAYKKSNSLVNKPENTTQYLPKLNNNIDKLDFTLENYIKIIFAKDTKQIKKLVNLFYHSITEAQQKSQKTNLFSKLFKKYLREIQTIPFKLIAKEQNSINELVEKNNHTLGGYSLSLNKTTNIAHINFLAVSPNIKKTRQSKETLKIMANRIYSNSKLNGMEYLTWTTSKQNKLAMKLFNKLNPEHKKIFLCKECDFIINLEEFKKSIDNIKIKQET